MVGTVTRSLGATVAALFLCLCTLADARSEGGFPLSNGMPVSAPESNVLVLEDPSASGRTSPEQIIGGQLDAQFAPRAAGRSSVGVTDKQWWLKFEARNDTSEPVEWVINFPFRIMDEVDIFHLVDGELRETVERGDKRPPVLNSVSGGALATTLTTPAQSDSTVYVRFLNRMGDNVDTYFEVSSIPAFTEKQSLLAAMYGAVLGGGVLLFLYNLIVFAFVRSRVYFWYLTYFACALTTFCFATGIVGHFYPTHTSLLSEAVPPFVSALTFMLVVQFSRSFLDTSRTHPKFDLLLRCLMIYFVIPPLLFMAGSGDLAALTVMTGALLLSVLPVFAAWQWMNGNRQARTFTLAWSVWVLAVTILVSRFLGLVPTNDLTLNIAWLGILAEAVLFALALAERMLLLIQEKTAAEKRERETIERLNRELEGLVKERTAQLQAKHDELVSSNQQKDKFFSIIAHDLMGPFNTLIGGSHFLYSHTSSLSNEKISEYAKDLNTAAVNLHKLLENLLSWAQLQKGEIGFSPEKGNLSESINQIAALFRPAARQKDIELLITAPKICITKFDRDIVETILRNLLNNAVKFSRPGGRIMIDLVSSPGSVAIAIKDNGIGIASDKLADLMELEQKFSTVGTSGEKGSGLGLQLCRELSALHNGRLEVESVENQGSIFTLHLPIEEDPGETSAMDRSA